MEQCIMGLLEVEYRTVRTRGLVYTQVEMDHQGIVRVYNSFGSLDHMDDIFVDRFLEDVFRLNPGTSYLQEDVVKLGKFGQQVRVVSVIMFRDIFMSQIYAIRHSKDYELGMMFPTLLN